MMRKIVFYFLIATLVAVTALDAAADRKTGGKKPKAIAAATAPATAPAATTKAKQSTGKTSSKKVKTTPTHTEKPAVKHEVEPSSDADYESQLARWEAEREAESMRVINELLQNMVTVQGGTFEMGATSEQGSSAEGDERPSHNVTLSTFQIGRYEVTQREWRAVMGNNPSVHSGNDLPVHYVSWDDCQQFIAQLNLLTGLRFRLPTEAEWEYAARGGNQSRHTIYAGGSNANMVAWTERNSASVPHPVGTLAANELGLYDMSGNVWEWCSDWYAHYSRSNSTPTNPAGPSKGSERIIRGGGWGFEARGARVSYRMHAVPDGRFDFTGLRLALDVTDQPQSFSPQPVSNETDESIFTSVEQPPTYPGGESALMKYMSSHMRYFGISQKQNIQGQVVARFVVEKDGSVGDVEIVKSLDEALDREVCRVCKTLPNFYPGRSNGQPVRAWYTLPINFKLENKAVK